MAVHDARAITKQCHAGASGEVPGPAWRRMRFPGGGRRVALFTCRGCVPTTGLPVVMSHTLVRNTKAPERMQEETAIGGLAPDNVAQAQEPGQKHLPVVAWREIHRRTI